MFPIRADAHRFLLRIYSLSERTLTLEITALNRRIAGSRAMVVQSAFGASTWPRFLITIHARCKDGVWFSAVALVGRRLVRVGRPWKRGFHIGLSASGWRCIRIVRARVLQKLMRGLDRRHARRYKMYPGAAFRIHDRSRGGARRGWRWMDRRKKKILEKSSIAGTRRVAKNPRAQCVTRHMIARECTIHRNRPRSRLNVKRCTLYRRKFCTREYQLYIKVDANVSLFKVC